MWHHNAQQGSGKGQKAPGMADEILHLPGKRVNSSPFILQMVRRKAYSSRRESVSFSDMGTVTRRVLVVRLLSAAARNSTGKLSGRINLGEPEIDGPGKLGSAHSTPLLICSSIAVR